MGSSLVKAEFIHRPPMAADNDAWDQHLRDGGPAADFRPQDYRPQSPKSADDDREMVPEAMVLVTTEYTGCFNVLEQKYNQVLIYEDPTMVPDCWWCGIGARRAKDWMWIKVCRGTEALEQHTSLKVSRWEGYLWAVMCDVCWLEMFLVGLDDFPPRNRHRARALRERRADDGHWSNRNYQPA